MISEEIVENVLERVSTFSASGAQELVNQMAKEQPTVLAYLMVASRNKVFTRDEGETFFFIGMVICQIMKEGGFGVRQITEDDIDRAEKANEELLEKLESDSEGDFMIGADSAIENYPEPEVLRYMTDALMEIEEEDAENSPFSEESLGYAFLYLKIMLDALVESGP